MKISARLVAGHDRRDHAGDQNQGAVSDRPAGAPSVGISADQRREPVHAEDMDRDHQARKLGLAVIAHVERRHRHHRHHHGLAHRQGGHRQQRHRFGPDRPPGGAQLATGPLHRGQAGPFGPHQRGIGPEPDRGPGGGDHVQENGGDHRSDPGAEPEERPKVSSVD